MGRTESLRQQIAAAAMPAACREDQLAIAASLLFGRTSQQYHIRCCRGQHVLYEGRHVTLQVSFDCFRFVQKRNLTWDFHSADVEDFFFIFRMFTLSNRVTHFRHFKPKYRLQLQGSKGPARKTLDPWRCMVISKSAIQSNQPEEKNTCFTLNYSILLSVILLAECSIAKRKAANQ